MMPADNGLRVLLIGEESAGAQALRAVARGGHRIAGVMTSGEDQGTVSVAAVARDLGAPVWPARLVKDATFADAIRPAQVDIILNVHSLYIVRDEILAAARIGAFNMHPGPLPEYAGLNTVSWAIFQGETSYGVTVHWMVPRVDAGPIAYQSRFSIDETDTPLWLMHKCVRAGMPLIQELLTAASANPERIPRVPQDLSTRRYYGKAVPEDGWLSWDRPARAVVRWIRACDYSPYPSPWGHPRVRWGDREISVLNAARTHKRCAGVPGVVGEADQFGMLVAAADEWVSVGQLEIAGRCHQAKDVLKAGDRLAGRQTASYAR